MSGQNLASAAIYWIHSNGQQNDVNAIQTQTAFLSTASQAGGPRMLQPLNPEISTDVLYSATVRGIPQYSAFSYYTNGNLSFGSPEVPQTNYLIYFALTSLHAVQASVQISSPGIGMVSLLPTASTSANPNGWTTQFSSGQLYMSFEPSKLSKGETPMLPIVSVFFRKPTNTAIVKVTNLQPPPMDSIAKGLQLQCVLANAKEQRLQPYQVDMSTQYNSPSRSPSSTPPRHPDWKIGLYIGIGGVVLAVVVLLSVFLHKRRTQNSNSVTMGIF